MKRLLLIVCVLLVAVISAGAFYFKIGNSQEERRDQYVKKGPEILDQVEINEADTNIKNAAKADLASAEARYELEPGFLQEGDLSRSFGEPIRTMEQSSLIPEQNQTSFTARYRAAKRAMAEKDPDRALKELQEALHSDPNSSSTDIAKTYVNIGTVQVVKKDFKAAEKAYRKALEIEPRLVQAQAALSSLYLIMGKQKKAEEELLIARRADPENERLLHLLGLFYSRTRQFDSYEKLYRDFLRKKPNSLAAKKRLAEVFIPKGNFKQAKVYAEEILKAQPGDTDGLYIRGKLYLAEKAYRKAIGDLSVVTQKSPRFAQGFYYLAMAHLRAGQNQQAKVSLAKATELSPRWLQPRLTLAQVHLALGDHKLALEESEKILKINSKSQRALHIAGVAQLKSGERENAMALFRKAQKLNPKDPTSYINIGNIYALEKNYDQAVKEYDAALKLDPERISALRPIARIQLLQGKREAALERVQQHLTKTKRQAPVYQLLGQLTLGGKDYAKGIKYLEKAVKLNPGLSSAYLLIAQAYMAQKKYDQAIDEYQNIIQKNPRVIQPHMLLGAIYDQKKQYDKANKHYQKILEIQKNFSPAANNLAWNYAEHGGNLDVALEMAQKARKDNPENPEIADTLGWIYYKKGEYGTAVAMLEESSEKFRNNNPTVLYHLGMAHYKLANNKEAKRALVKAMKLNPEFPEAEQAKSALEELK